MHWMIPSAHGMRKLLGGKRMRRLRRQPAGSEVGLMAHMRAAVWGPAEFVGLPPWRLVGEGLFIGALGAGAIVGAGGLGMWAGPPTLRSGEAGLAVACVLALYLFAIRAGRALVGVVALLGVCVALLTPQAAAGFVLAYRGQEQQVVVTSVESVDQAVGGRARYLCSVEGGARADLARLPRVDPAGRRSRRRVRPAGAGGDTRGPGSARREEAAGEARRTGLRPGRRMHRRCRALLPPQCADVRRRAGPRRSHAARQRCVMTATASHAARRPVTVCRRGRWRRACTAPRGRGRRPRGRAQ